MKVDVDVKISGVEKLLDIVDRTFGLIFSRKEANNDAYKLIAMSKAKAESMKLLADAIELSSSGLNTVKYEADGITLEVGNVVQRSRNRNTIQEIKRQINIEGIVLDAAKELENDNNVDKKAVDDDWLTRFFNYAQDVSNEEMQKVWAKVLANQVRKPDSFSLRSLEMIRLLSVDDAALIKKAGTLALSFQQDSYLFKGNDHKNLVQYGLSYTSIATLVNIGILQAGDSTVLALDHWRTNIPIFFEKYLLVISKTNQQELPVYLFSKVGREILRLLAPETNLHYFRGFAEWIHVCGGDVKYQILVDENGNRSNNVEMFEFDFKPRATQ